MTDLPEITTLPSATPRARRRGRVRLGTVLLAAITIPLALLTLVGLEPFPLLSADVNAMAGAVSQLIIQFVTVAGALAVVIGIFNLLGTHLRGLRRMPRGLYSLFTILTMVAVLAIHILERTGTLKVGDSTEPLLTLTMLDVLQVVIETALGGLLFFFLVFAAFRLMRRGVSIWSALFIAALVIVLLGAFPPTGLEILTTLRDWLLGVPVNAGIRGLLIGVAIGTIVVGIRVLIGQDRVYGE